jgi:hypothetical protein
VKGTDPMSGFSLRRTTSSRSLAITVLAALLALTAACGGTTDTDDDGSDTGEATVITIQYVEDVFTVDGQPAGTRITVRPGPIDIQITADAPGELHIHSNPEHTLTFGEGTETFPIQIDQPGIVEVESHDHGHLLVAQLEVRP